MKVYEAVEPSSTVIVVSVGELIVAVKHSFFRVILKVYPLLLVLLASLTVDVTVKSKAVLSKLLSLVEIVTVLPETEIHEKVDRSGEKVSVSV